MMPLSMLLVLADMKYKCESGTECSFSLSLEQIKLQLIQSEKREISLNDAKKNADL